MREFRTRLENLVRELIVCLDYLIWLVFDPSKFVIIKKEKIKKVLVIHLGAIGELLATTPVLRALKHDLNAQITFMVSPGRESIFKNNPNVDRILFYQNSFSKNLAQIKKERYDLAVIMWPAYPSVSLMCLLAGIKYRIGCFKNIKDGINFFFSRRILYLRRNHAIQTNLDVVRLIGVDNKSPKIEFYFSKKEEKKAKSLLKKFKLGSYIVVHPGFSTFSREKYSSRAWPLDRYAKTVDFIIKKYKLKVILSGSSEEKPFSEEIRAMSKNKKNIFVFNGLTNLGELAYIVSKARLLIAPSTGLVHLATAFDTKIIQLSGSERVEAWSPWTDKNRYRVLFHPEVCIECDKGFCRKKNQECMKAITVKEAMDAADFLLGS